MTTSTPTTYPNRYEGSCYDCRTRVPAQAGVTARIAGRYVVWCAAHAPVVAASSAPALAVLALHLSGARLDLQGRLDATRFAAYRQAQTTAGARWDAQVGAVVLRLDQVGALVAALDAAGIPVKAEQGLDEALRAARAAAEAEVEAATARAAQVDEALRAQGRSLYPYQRTGIAWLAPRAGALLADDMGLGKTVQALVAAPAGAPLLVVCPAVAKGVWLREGRRWRPDLRITVLAGRGSFRWPDAGELVVVNYDILPQIDTITAAPEGTVIVADEAHALKTAQAQRTERFRALAAAARRAGGRSWLLTATPILGQPPELYALLAAAGVEREGIGGWDGLVAAYDGERGRYGWSWPRLSLREADLRRLQGVMLRRTKSEVLTDLPIKVVEDLRVEVDAATVRACGLALAAAEKRGGIDKVCERIAEGGLAFEEIAAARAALAVGKIPALTALLDGIAAEQSGPVVVFSAHRAAVDLIGARPGWAAITGDTAPEERSRIEARFQAGQLDGIAATIKAGGVAITLTRANRALFLDLEWSGSLNTQAEDRIYRIGQDRGVQITRLVADHPLDERLTEILCRKAALVDGSIDAARRGAEEEVSSVPEVEQALATLEAAHAKAQAAFDALAAQDEAWRTLVAQIEADEAAQSDDERAAEQAAERFALAVARAVERREGTLGQRREAASEREVWALHALALLSDADLDYAKEDNGMGFSKADTYRGHALHWLAMDGGLDDAAWEEAVALCAHYRRQVGSPPARA